MLPSHEDFIHANVPLPDDLHALMEAGDYAAAGAHIDHRLSLALPAPMQARLRLAKFFLNQYPLYYTLTKDELIQAMQEKVPDFSQEDIERLALDGWLDSRMVKGRRRYMKDSADSLLKAHPEMARRAGHALTPDNKQLDSMMQQVKSSGSLRARILLNTQMQIKDAHFAPDTYRVHLPLPRPSLMQQNIRIEDCQPTPRHIARESVSQRTAFFEETLAQNTPFSATFSYENHLHYADLWDETPGILYPHVPPPTREDLSPALPHMAFTPYLVALAHDIKGQELFPLRMARAVYQWVTSHVRYAYQRPYRLIENGAEYAATTLRGDCGLQALLFITLCRILGIPARWESGLFVSPDHVGCHDWALFYTEAHGWLPADCSFGGSAYRAGNEERRRYYFGNLDPYRLATTSAYYAPFQPSRLFLRNDPYDNQRGEIETPDRPLKEDAYRTTFTLQDMTITP